ncbi:MAG: OmpA family protein [Pseudomonadota bacterium]
MRHSEIIALASLAAMGFGALLFGKYVAKTLERTIEEEARQKLAVIGFSDIEVQADGLVLALSGRVRSERDHEALTQTFGAMAGVSEVVDRIAVVAPPIELRPTVLVVQKDGDAFTLSGEAPDASTRDILVSKAQVATREIAPGAQLLNLLKAQDRGEPPTHWLSAAEAAIEAVAELRVGRATVERDLLRLEGAAPNAEVKAEIEATLQRKLGALTRLNLDISSPPPFLSPYTFRAEKRDGAVAITQCAAPDQQRRSVILGALTATGQAAQDPATTRCQIATGAPNEAWADAAARALETLAGLEAGEVAMIDDRIRLVGFLTKGVDVEAARERAAADWPDGFGLDLDLSEEFPVVSPFALSIVKRPGEVKLSGYAPSIERAEAWADRLGAINELALARGAPPEFSAAVGVVVDALAELKVGSAELRDTRFKLAAPGDELERAALADRLSNALPAGYRLAVEEARAPSALLGETPAAATSGTAALPTDRFLFTARRYDSGSTEVVGVVGDGATRAIVQAYARAKLGGDQMSINLGLRDATSPAGWQRALFAGLEALSELDAGEVTVERNAIYLRGRVEQADQARIASTALEDKTPRDYTRFSRITVAEPDLSIGLEDDSPLEPVACVGRLNAIVADAAIVFDSGSVVIDQSSFEEVEALAETLRRCPTARIEIGGHTDSSGPADANESLSLRRAQALLRNLAVRGVAENRLEAIGYGETQPVGDNETEEGRARNRRIEFKLLP